MNRAAILSGLGFLALAACSEPSSASHSVVYRIEGTAKVASLTMTNAQGGTEQTRAFVPFTRFMDVNDGNFVYISAQNERGGDRLSCSISVDGAPFKQSTSLGRYAVADCSGIVGERP